MPDTQTNERPTTKPRPVVLCILDGWGERDGGEDNAIHHASKPNLDRMYETYPHASLEASALDVGLPAGQMGNSEVGHMNLGAGRVVMQDLPRIDAAVEDGSIADVPALQDLIAKLKASGGVCHMMGLVSPGGVHSHQDHLIALAKIVDEAGIAVRLHAYLDGRDTPPSSAEDYLEQVLEASKGLNNFAVATVSGRYYSMDRDKNWDRVEKAYRAVAEGTGEAADDALSAITNSYANNVTDEFVLPTVVGEYTGMKDGDGLLMFNFRADRAREILTTLVDSAFDGFARGKTMTFAAKVGLTEYSTELNAFLETMFPQQQLEHILGEIVSEAGLTQLRIAETEKYSHVTFFFNGGQEQVFAGEERILVPSPKIATYDLQPEMSAPEVTDKLVEAIRSEKFDLIVVNYANGDMVGHTGDFDAAKKAAETVDTCLGRLEEALVAAGGAMLITADHGNAEKMSDADTGQPHTAHTLSLVPAILVNPPDNVQSISDGVLADVAPTLLAMLQLPQPGAMTGRSLITLPADAAA
jgi:2,3-bisphosphoglycerate-independent phosphoglycerate mutase